MLLDKNSLKIKIPNLPYLNLSPYLLQVEYSYNKLWGKDTGRTINGKWSGSCFGYIPKIKLTFAPLSEEELENVAKYINASSMTIYYYDPTFAQYKEIVAYSGDFGVSNKNTFENISRANESFDISIIGADPIPFPVIRPPV